MKNQKLLYFIKLLSLASLLGVGGAYFFYTLQQYSWFNVLLFFGALLLLGYVVYWAGLFIVAVILGRF